MFVPAWVGLSRCAPSNSAAAALFCLQLGQDKDFLMDNRPVTITVIIEHPDADDPINATTQVPANEFGPDVMRHMCESLYGVIKDQALRSKPSIIMPKRGLLQ
jgi:hypothetical protein